MTSQKLSPAEIFAVAQAKATEAFIGAVPTPMIVGTPTTPLGSDIDPTKKTYYVSEGLCGFASVNIRPARGKFVTWLKAEGIGKTNSYSGGYDLWSTEVTPESKGSQSYERKVKACRAFVSVLRDNGITAYVDSRLD